MQNLPEPRLTNLRPNCTQFSGSSDSSSPMCCIVGGGEPVTVERLSSVHKS